MSWTLEHCVSHFNHRQPMKKHILFLCSQNKLRSPTAEAIFADHPAIEVDSAGLNNDADIPLSEEQIKWADLIIVMEKAHRIRLNRKFKRALAGKRIAVLDIPDEYEYMEPSLVALLKSRCASYIL
jgi:predicted protein tyrosine phosphatase